MKAGDMYYIGSMGQQGNYKGWPVLIISVDGSHGSCYGLLNGNIRWYRIKDLRSDP